MVTKATSQGRTYDVIGDDENVTATPAPKIRDEFIFRGTPYQFWLFVKDNDDGDGNLSPELFYTDGLQPGNDKDNALVYFRSLPDDKASHNFGWTGAIFTNQVGRVKAEALPEKDKTKLIVTSLGEYWPELSKTWEILRAALDRAGWMETAGVTLGNRKNKAMPRVPQRKESEYWKTVWRVIRPFVGKGYHNDDLLGKLAELDKDIVSPSEKIFADILRAGEAGLLD